MFSSSRGARVRRITTVTLAAALVSLAAAWAPAPVRTDSAASMAVDGRMAAVSGVYVLQRASGKRPPIPFEMSVAGGAVA
jgi:hypothetical protein